jgi:hypothetical protein
MQVNRGVGIEVIYYEKEIYRYQRLMTGSNRKIAG